MDRSHFIIKSGRGKNTILDKEYKNLIETVVDNEEKEDRWEVYNLVINELFKIDNGIYFQEIKYRLTDKEDPNKVILDVLSRYENHSLTGFVFFLKKRIEEYTEDDFFKRFFE
jgi:hypothetical protein